MLTRLLMAASGRKWRRALKAAFAIAVLWAAAAHFLPSWGEVESVEHLKAAQRRLEDKLRETNHGQGWDEENDLEEKQEGNRISGGRGALGANEFTSAGSKSDKERPGKEAAYANSNSLRERLRPKLVSLQSNPNDEPWASDLGAARSAQDVRVREEGYRTFAFNSLVSQRLGPTSRAVPDTRHEECRKKEYDLSGLPTASIIICYYHEEINALLRTVHTAVDRSPEKAIFEVILVDDRSDLDIAANVTDHLQRLNLSSLVRVAKAPERLGLIRARIFGARMAQGDVLVFLDSHVECNVGWLTPLLDRIKVICHVLVCFKVLFHGKRATFT